MAKRLAMLSLPWRMLPASEPTLAASATTPTRGHECTKLQNEHDPLATDAVAGNILFISFLVNGRQNLFVESVNRIGIL